MQLAEDLPGVSLALSLHAPNQELRARIVPSARAYRLDKLMAAVDAYSAKSGQKASLPACAAEACSASAACAHGPDVCLISAVTSVLNPIRRPLPWAAQLQVLYQLWEENWALPD